MALEEEAGIFFLAFPMIVEGEAMVVAILLLDPKKGGLHSLGTRMCVGDAIVDEEQAVEQQREKGSYAGSCSQIVRLNG